MTLTVVALLFAVLAYLLRDRIGLLAITVTIAFWVVLAGVLLS